VLFSLKLDAYKKNKKNSAPAISTKKILFNVKGSPSKEYLFDAKEKSHHKKQYFVFDVCPAVVSPQLLHNCSRVGE